MSLENVEIVRRAYEHTHATGRVYAQAMAPDFVWTGTAAMAEVWRQWLGAWGRFKSEAEAFRELSDGSVVVLVRGHGRSKTSTLEVVDRSANVFDIRGGRVTRLTIYNLRDSALADLGLEE